MGFGTSDEMAAKVQVSGCFTIERNILGLTTSQIEQRLGFRKGRLAAGARILVLEREPQATEFECAGSTRFPNGRGLDVTILAKTKFRPGAWYGQRLVKVDPVMPHSGFEWYPPASSIAAEQWILTKNVPAQLVCIIKGGETYR